VDGADGAVQEPVEQLQVVPAAVVAAPQQARSVELQQARRPHRPRMSRQFQPQISPQLLPTRELPAADEVVRLPAVPAVELVAVLPLQRPAQEEQQGRAAGDAVARPCRQAQP
jgi:hypothetical protein